MLTRTRSTRLIYEHTEQGVQVRVFVPSSIQIGPDGSRWSMFVFHEAHMRVVSELTEHHTTQKHVFSPEPLPLPLGLSEGDMVLELRAKTTARRLMTMKYLRDNFGPIAEIFANAMKHPGVRKVYLREVVADREARRCRACGVSELPDDTTYNRIVDEITTDPPSMQDIWAVEKPVGLPREVLRAATSHDVPHHRR